MRVSLTSKTTFPLLSRDNLLVAVQDVALKRSSTPTKPSNENDRKVMLSLPNHASQSLVDGNFYMARNLIANIMGKEFELDVVSSIDWLFEYPWDIYFKHVISPSEIEKGVAELVKGGVYEDAITFQFKKSMVSIARTALRDMDDKDTLEAISFLINVAQSGKKIIVVYSHGGTEHKSGNWKLTGFKNTVYANDVIEALSEEYSDEQTGAIYLLSCNRDNLPIKQPELPTVIHTDVARTSFQDHFNAPAKVYWPS